MPCEWALMEEAGSGFLNCVYKRRLFALRRKHPQRNQAEALVTKRQFEVAFIFGDRDKRGERDSVWRTGSPVRDFLPVLALSP